ncbi:hemerythrin domain-containing protein [Kingella negevensis]|uniref:Hemerythrin-like domain-containing protein n=1 Tax=Kingella negevensis TaxID=1522312 RepID=A0A238TAY3_9NEIS|nr:hemerythrin domain-containing protein [Kingella negevensis]MDK4680677.1 hemerythrin domain-containing protein [Kingella negevensis]MDK4681600.1 hemerythrin domain-containing protein [Kingella negevensis]MDK4683684.1 hemerythrin domain-containing protein [Kingella negevensis]MDK4689798.1 hemerythrin domain-containing protein [Kingella negevensis]MDK4692858.1 hemerythrin domain-containing protein [Kingella negevensis]
MKRHATLINLSQEHHHTLALCLRILRDPEQNHQKDITEHFLDLEKHFSTEERQFAPLWPALNRPDLRERFEHDHAQLRQMFQAAKFDDTEWNTQFATLLRDHARFEERELFPELETKAL